MPTKIELEVLQVEEEWLKAHLEVDIQALDGLMHEDYQQIKPNGEVWGKREALASFQGGERYWDEAESDQIEVRIYGQTAIVTGRWKARGVNHGEIFDYAARYVSVWVKASGKWMMVSDQSTEIQE